MFLSPAPVNVALTYFLARAQNAGSLLLGVGIHFVASFSHVETISGDFEYLTNIWELHLGRNYEDYCRAF